MKVEIHLNEQSQPIVVENVINTYQKGDLFCVYCKDEVYKFPINHIFRIKENYKDEGRTFGFPTQVLGKMETPT